MEYATIIAAAVSAIGMLINQGQNQQAQDLRRQIAAKYTDLPLPVLDKAVARTLPPDSAAKYMADTKAKSTQGEVLDKYMDEARSGGETIDDRAAYIRMQNEAAGIANAANGAVQRQMQNRGLGGSGLSFALMQQGAQAAANRANETGIAEAQHARGRYMDALARGGDLAGRMRGQELQEMGAIDAINMFNARQQTDADRYNNTMAQQQWENKKSLVDSEANAMNGVAAGTERAGQQAQNAASGLSNAIGTFGEAWDQKKKKEA